MRRDATDVVLDEPAARYHDVAAKSPLGGEITLGGYCSDVACRHHHVVVQWAAGPLGFASDDPPATSYPEETGGDGDE